ncbi:hypothetical protein [Labrenzia sp. PHM005]|uniref:hypothetical protein n=1 Tax=Labrenzia sp. PHM005 TaxID=2590016 RepID=UPI00113FFD68|nr:hypothetical protein [Labrenzia sp. PHM005]QDG77059.1 hypothetical protein FJ695_14900 [Labrenzia sp. PHM005]
MSGLPSVNITRRKVLAGGTIVAASLPMVRFGNAAASDTDLLIMENSFTRMWRFPKSSTQSVLPEAIRRRQTPGLLAQRLLQSDSHLTVLEEWLPKQPVPDFLVSATVSTFSKLPI